MSVFWFSLLLGIPAGSAVVCALLRERKWIEIVSVVSTGLTFSAVLWVSSLVLAGDAIKTPKEWFFIDPLSAYLLVIVTGSALVVTLYSIGYLRRQIERNKVGSSKVRMYYTLLNAFLCTMNLVLVSNNLGFLWIGAESTTLATAFLVAFYERESSIEAAWKYVIICSVGIALALFGIILTYFSALHVVSSEANALNWTTLVSVGKRLDPNILKLAFVFILVGFGTKAGLVPFHTWKPDAYSEAPAPITALMATGLVNVALYALIRFYILVNKAVDGDFAPHLFIIFGLVSMGVAVPFILLQRDFKRLLAYSSVEHVGIIVFALGLGTPLAYFGALLHMLGNTLAKLVLFLTAGEIRIAFDSKIIRRVTGGINVIPMTSVLFMAGLFAVTGWPPFGLFVSELSIIIAGFSSGAVVASILFMGFIATIFIGFIYYGTSMIFGEPSRHYVTKDGGSLSLIVLAILVVFLLVLGTMMPAVIHDFIMHAVTVIQA